MSEDKLRCIIVDDEAKGRRVLRTLCKDYCPNVEVVGEADSADAAKTIILRLRPDFIFLDIHMPVKDGFQLLESFDTHTDFKIIFTTAYDQYAVQAFRFATVDYLLKPIDIDELSTAVEKLAKSRRRPNDHLRMKALQQNMDGRLPNKIALATAEGYIFIEPVNIIRCEAYGNYTKIFQSGGERSVLIAKTLKHFEDLLGGSDFFRIHKSHLVNLYQVKRYVKGKPAKLIMSDDSEVEISVRKKDSLVARLTSL